MLMSYLDLHKKKAKIIMAQKTWDESQNCTTSAFDFLTPSPHPFISVVLEKTLFHLGDIEWDGRGENERVLKL